MSEPRYAICRECKGTGRLPLSWAFAGICLRCNSTGQVRIDTDPAPQPEAREAPTKRSNAK